MNRTLHTLIVASAFVLGLAPANAQVVTVPLNSNFQGEIADPAHPTAFAFEGIAGIKATIVVTGDGDFRPFVRVLDSGGVDVLASAASDGSGTASIPAFVPTVSATYLLEVNSGAEQPTGTFQGSLQGKLPKEMKSAKFPKDSQPGDTLSFFALAGTQLSGKLRIWTKPHPATAWFRITGPTGVIDSYFQTKYAGFNKYAILKKVVLPETGIYTISPSQPIFRLTGKVTLKPPSSGSGSVDVGDDPFVGELPEPVLAALPAATISASVTVSGTATDATQVEISTQGNVVVADVVGGAFSASLPLVQNTRNVIFATALGIGGARSRPAIARVVHDTEPPALSILSPINNASLVGSTAHVSGVVGDRLSPLGVTVTVNTLAANVDLDGGEYGSFERRDVALAASTTTLTVIARDVLGNQVSKSISVKKATVTGFPTLALTSGDGQSGVVGSELSAPLVVKVSTSSGAAFANKLVEFKTIRGDGLLGTTPGFSDGKSRLLVSTDSSGFASVRMRLGSDAGPGANRVSVSSAGIVGVLEFSLTATAKAAATISAVTGNMQIGPLGASLPRSLVARVTDGRNPVANANVRFQVLTGAGAVNGAVETVVATDALGLARADWRLGRTDSNQRVIASLVGGSDFVAYDAKGVKPSLVTTTSIAGVVHDTSNQPLGGATAQLFVNGAAVATTQTAIDGRFQFGNLTSLGTARVVIDGSTVNLVGDAGTGTGVAPTFTYASHSLPPFAITRGTANVIPLPVLLPAFDQGKKTYNGTGDQSFTHPQLDAFKVSIASGTVVTLANGQTVPGAAGSVQIGVALVPADDLPTSIPDGLAPQIGIVIDPPFARFGTPLPVEAPNTAGLPYGARAKLLQYEFTSGRFEVVSELVSNGRTLVSEAGTGLTRSGFAVVATGPIESMARVECAALALATFARALEAARAQTESDAEDAGKIVGLAADLTDALSEFRAEATAAVADGDVDNAEWNSLRGALGAVEDALRDNDIPGAKRATIAAALALDGGFDVAIAEASGSDCAASIVAAATTAKNEYTTGLESLLAQLDAILASRESALAATGATVSTLRTLLAAAVPPPDAATLLAAPTSQFDSAETQLDAAAIALGGVLAGSPDQAIDAAAAPLVAAFDGVTGSSVLAGFALRAAGQMAFVGADGGVSIRGIPADGTRHVVSALEVTATTTRFGESPLFTAEAGVESAPAAITPANAPAATVIAVSLLPAIVDVPVGQAAQFTLSANQAYGPVVDATGEASGTTWRSSDTALVAVSADGSASSVVPGVVYVTARHKDLVAARKVTAIGNHQVTIFGTAMLTATTPAAGAAISTTIGGSTTAASDGSFVLPLAVPSNSNNVTLIATTVSSGQTLNGVAFFTIDSSGPADAGVLTLTVPANVLIAKAASMVVGTGTVNNNILTMNNGLFAVAGTAYNTAFCCWWNSPNPTVEYDLVNKHVIFSAVLQGDSNDTYIVEILDSFTNTWKVLWDVPTMTSAGTGVYSRPHPTDVTQKYQLPVPMIGSKIRLRAGSGDGNYGVAELQLYGVVTN